MSSSIGTLFKVSTFGESHGPVVGAVVDGCPARITLCESDIQAQLDRRRPGRDVVLTSKRDEKDIVKIISGVNGELTLGTPITLMVQNTDCRPSDYKDIAEAPRPSHADYTYRTKYGILASSGGGRASARETVGRVAAGAVAEKFLQTTYGVEIVAWVSSVGNITARDHDHNSITRAEVDGCGARCPDVDAGKQMADLIETARKEDDSVGGIITCVCRNLPVGWGEPVFDKLDAMLAHAMLSIPAAKGFEIGSGFDGTKKRGSEHNDIYIQKGDKLGTATNRSGGVQGGISNGEPIFFRVAFKPVATIGREQKSADYNGKTVSVKHHGRHDPCVAPRAVPIVEAMAAIILADSALRHYIIGT